MNGEQQKKRVMTIKVRLAVMAEFKKIKEEMGATWEDFVLIGLDIMNEEPDLPGSIVFRTTQQLFDKMHEIKESEKVSVTALEQALMEAYGVEEPQQDERSQTGGE